MLKDFGFALAGRQPLRRSTAYGEVSGERIQAALNTSPLVDVVNTPAKKYGRKSAGKVKLIANA